MTIDAYGVTIHNRNSDNDHASVFTITGDHVTIKGPTVDGHRDDFAAATEHRHGLYLAGASDVTLRDVTLYGNKGDGLHVAGVWGVPGSATEGLYADNLQCLDNHRNGASIISLVDGYFTGCRFNRTSGTAPEAGVDVEPNTIDDVIDAVRFEGCWFLDNGRYGFVTACDEVEHQAGIAVSSSTIARNPTRNVWIGGSKRVAFTDNDIHTSGRGFHADTTSHLMLNGNRINRHDDEGTLFHRTDHLTLTGNDLTGNGTAVRYDQDDTATRIAHSNQGVVGATVSGARDSGEGALADLLTELAAMGLITDATTPG